MDQELTPNDRLTLMERTDISGPKNWYIVFYSEDSRNSGSTYAKGMTFPDAIGTAARQKAETYCEVSILDAEGTHREILTDIFDVNKLAKQGFNSKS